MIDSLLSLSFSIILPLGIGSLFIFFLIYRWVVYIGDYILECFSFPCDDSDDPF